MVHYGFIMAVHQMTKKPIKTKRTKTRKTVPHLPVVARTAKAAKKKGEVFFSSLKKFRVRIVGVGHTGCAVSDRVIKLCRKHPALDLKTVKFPPVAVDTAHEEKQVRASFLRDSDLVILFTGPGVLDRSQSFQRAKRLLGTLKSSSPRDALVLCVVPVPSVWFPQHDFTGDKTAYVLLNVLRHSCDGVVVANCGNELYAAEEAAAMLVELISSTVLRPSLVGFGFSDVRRFFVGNQGVSFTGSGMAYRLPGTDPVQSAVRAALWGSSLGIERRPLRDCLMRISGGPDLTLEEVNKVHELVSMKFSIMDFAWAVELRSALNEKYVLVTALWGE